MPKYTCTKCGCAAFSKNPGTRSVFLENESLAMLRAVLSANLEPDPNRPGKKDFVIRISLWEGEETYEKGWSKLEGYVSYFNRIAPLEGTTPEAMKKQWLCGLEGHDWHSPDPPEV